MPVLKDYRIFISHAWKYGDDYDRLVSLLDQAPNFSYWNYSGPSDHPLVEPNETVSGQELGRRIRRKIAPVGAVIIISGMYASYSNWMQFEIDTAVDLNKPIIGITPWGNQRTPNAVSEHAVGIVGWNTSSIVNAIRTYYK